MAAGLQQAALADNDDHVGVRGGGQAVRHDNGGASCGQQIHGGADAGVGRQIQ